MKQNAPPTVASLFFYATAPYPCSYLPEQMARSQVVVPGERIDSRMFSQLVAQGFRRSGTFVYRPYCDSCTACVPVRLAVNEFVPDRSQRRCWKRLQQLEASQLPLGFFEEHYQLYRRYQAARHADGNMAQDDPGQYREFILQSSVDSVLVEFREHGQLRMVSLIDCLGDGLSAVYTFFDPDLPQAGFGTFNVLWQVEAAKRLGLPYLYLGYWIRECRKMNYKSRFQPLQGLIDGAWRSLEME